MLGQIKISKPWTLQLALAVAVFLGILMFSSSVSATGQTESKEQGTENKEQKSLPNYKFVAEPCDSLTKLVRRAILTYDASNSLIKLTKARIIYVETNIVQDMGAYWLDIGDNVVISGQAVANYASKSRKLPRSQVLAWQRYVPSVDFSISSTQQPHNLKEIKEAISDFVEQEKPVPETPAAKSSAVWWFAGVGSAALVWYLLWKREDS